MTLATRVVIDATYKDEATNSEIPAVTSLCILDPKNNLAYSSPPQWFECDAKADVILLLATKNKLYISQEHVFSTTNIHKSGAYKFDMKDVTGKVNNAQELAQYLHISF